MDSEKLDSYVNPKHYGTYTVNLMPVEFLEELPHNLAEACKYLFRLGKKDITEIEIGKINWYLERALARDEYTEVPRYMPKLAPVGQDLNILIIRAIANRQPHVVERLRQNLADSYKEPEGKTFGPQSKTKLIKSNRIFNLAIDCKYYFKLSENGLLFSYTPIEDDEEAAEVNLDILPKEIIAKFNKFLDTKQTPDQEEIVETVKELIDIVAEEEEDED